MPSVLTTLTVTELARLREDSMDSKMSYILCLIGLSALVARV